MKYIYYTLIALTTLSSCESSVEKPTVEKEIPKITSGEILNQWEDTEIMMESDLFLIKEDGKLIMRTVYKEDGSHSDEVITQSEVSGKTRLDYDNKHNDHYFIEKNGSLGFYDKDGRFKVAKKK